MRLSDCILCVSIYCNLPSLLRLFIYDIVPIYRVFVTSAFLYPALPHFTFYPLQGYLYSLMSFYPMFASQIGYSQSDLLLAHNLIAAIAAFQWESALPLKQGSPNPPLSPWWLRSGGLP